MIGDGTARNRGAVRISGWVAQSVVDGFDELFTEQVFYFFRRRMDVIAS